MTEIKLKSGYVNSFDGKKLYFATNFDYEKSDTIPNLMVLNNGLVCSDIHWERQIPFLRDNKFPYLIHNYRGHFNSSGADDIQSITFGNIANDLQQILKKVKFVKVILVGHSMGVNVCLECTKVFPEIISGLILIAGTVLTPKELMFNSNIMDLTGDTWKNIQKKFPKFYDWIWKNTGKIPGVREIVRNGGFNKDTVDQDVVNRYLNAMGYLRPEIFFQLIEQMHAHDMINYLQEIHCPTLVIGGDKDQMIPKYASQVFCEKIRGAEMYVVKDGTHVPQLDFPEFINQRTLLFLKKHGLFNQIGEQNSQRRDNDLVR